MQYVMIAALILILRNLYKNTKGFKEAINKFIENYIEDSSSQKESQNLEKEKTALLQQFFQNLRAQKSLASSSE